ncbi:10493_t:CDS:2, partial [Acaulospora colombiana]
ILFDEMSSMHVLHGIEIPYGVVLLVPKEGVKSMAPIVKFDPRKAQDEPDWEIAESKRLARKRLTATAVAHAKEGRGLIRINGQPLHLVQPPTLRYKIYEPILMLGEENFSAIDIRVRVSGGGHTSQIYAIRQAIGKAAVAYWMKYYDASHALSLKKSLVDYDRSLVIADPRRMEPKKFGGGVTDERPLDFSGVQLYPSNPTISMPLSTEEYNNLSTEEREAYDAAERQREKEEQATLPYSWAQQLGDVDIVVPVPAGTRARDLAVTISKKKLSVGLKGKEPIMAGDLCQDIKDNKQVHVQLEKVNKQQWWANVLTHHPKIDTTKITPENRKLSDLDGQWYGRENDGKQLIHPMYRLSTEFLSQFDNQQKQMGKPTSDELKKME